MVERSRFQTFAARLVPDELSVSPADGPDKTFDGCRSCTRASVKMIDETYGHLVRDSHDCVRHGLEERARRDLPRRSPGTADGLTRPAARRQLGNAPSTPDAQVISRCQISAAQPGTRRAGRPSI